MRSWIGMARKARETDPCTYGESGSIDALVVKKDHAAIVISDLAKGTGGMQEDALSEPPLRDRVAQVSAFNGKLFSARTVRRIRAQTMDDNVREITNQRLEL